MGTQGGRVMVKPILIGFCDKRRVSSVEMRGVELLSIRRVACFVVFGAAAVTLAGYSAFAQRTNRAMLAAAASQDYLQPQTSNRAAKTARMETALLAVQNKPVFALASMGPDLPVERRADPVIASAMQIPDAAPLSAIEPEPKPAAVATLPPKPAEKPKHVVLPPPAAPAAQNNFLDDGQISGLKGRLRLTLDQVEYWPAVEAALRDVVRTQIRGAKHSLGAKLNIDVNSPEVQKLIWAAMPLLMRLRDDQKSEVRKLARVIGLDQVASQI